MSREGQKFEEQKRYKLEELADIAAGSIAPKKDCFTSTGIPFVRAGSLGELLSGGSPSDLELLTSEMANNLRMRLFPAGTVVFAKSGMSCMTGNVYVLPEPCYVVSHLACVVPKKGLANYLKHYFRFNRPNRLIENPSFPSIKLSKIKKIEIKLPNLLMVESQIQVLESICEQIEKAKFQLQYLDDLVKSRFIEMFGDNKWPVKTIGELATDIRYGTSKKASDSGRYTYLRMNNITDGGRLDFKDVKHIDLSGSELDKCMVVKGDLLFNRTNSREKVGKTAVFLEDTPMVIAGYIIRVRLGSKIDSEFLSQFMNLPTTKAMLRSIAKGAVHQANINSKELAGIKVPVPPISSQQEFLSFAHQVDKSKFTLKWAIEGVNATMTAILNQELGMNDVQ